MGRLKKRRSTPLNASSLTEVIVATSILLIVFSIAIATLNNMMVATTNNDTQRIETKMEQFLYDYRNNPIKIPIEIIENDLIYRIQRIQQQEIKLLEFSILNVVTKKRLVKNEIDLETE
tara:strand:+ start:4478 stop:4834 length:357 start_codon:yes stop_codon:yes gene_type:complete